MRWALELQEFNFEVEHCPGKDNELPDYLSRNPENDDPGLGVVSDTEAMLPPEREQEEKNSIAPMNEQPYACPADVQTLTDEVKNAQDNCPETQRMIRDRLELNNREPREAWERGFRNFYKVEDNYLIFKQAHQLYVPEGARTRVMYEHHDVVTAGHPGAEETERSIHATYHWPRIQKDVRNYVQGCMICAKYKRRPNYPGAPERPRQPTTPFEVLTLDVMGPYPETQSGNKYLFVVTNLFSRWVEAKPIRETYARSLIKIMDDDIFTRTGYPKAIITDNGTQFLSGPWLAACRRWQTLLWVTAIYNPRQNPTERRNQEIKKTLRIHLDGRPPNSWDQQIPNVLFNLRRRANAATGYSPSCLLYGRDLQLPGAWSGPGAERAPPTLEEIRGTARERQARYIEQRQLPEPDAPPPTYAEGDRVLMRDRRHLNRPTSKFRPLWTGPHRVVRRFGNTHMYLVDLGNRTMKVHTDQLRPAPAQRQLDGQPLQPPQEEDEATN